MPDEYLVVFTDHTDIRWLKILRRGFRHCFVLIRFADIWISIDPLMHKTDVMRLDIPDSISLKKWFEEQGDTVIEIKVISTTKPKPLPLAPFSCVEAVKRVLGIRQAYIFTPYQLYKFLKKKENKVWEV